MIIIRRVIKSISTACFGLENLDNRYQNLLSKISEIEGTYKDWDTDKNAARGYRWDLSDNAIAMDAKLSRRSSSVFNPQSVKNPSSRGLSRGGAIALLAGLGVAGTVGAGAYFIRKRRSKNGKQIIERVRR